MSPGRRSPAPPSPLKRDLARVERFYAEVLSAATPPAEPVHQLHRQLRALRARARAFRSLLPPARRKVYTAELRRLGRMARRTGELRDRTVIRELLDHPEARRRIPRVTRELAHHLLDQEDAVGLAFLRTYLGSEPRRGSVRRLVDLTRVSAGKVPRWKEAFTEELERKERELERRFRRAGRRPSVRRLHRLRRALRNLSVLEASGGRTPDPSRRRLSRRRERLQRRLGRLHDLEIFREWVARLPSPGGEDLSLVWRKEESRRLAQIRLALARAPRRR